jgi:uncharacterized lipoprotein YddW (UPF0748 family)
MSRRSVVALSALALVMVSSSYALTVYTNHFPPVPRANEDVEVAVRFPEEVSVSEIANLQLNYSVTRDEKKLRDGVVEFRQTSSSPAAPRDALTSSTLWVAHIPGQPAGALVTYWVAPKANAEHSLEHAWRLVAARNYYVGTGDEEIRAVWVATWRRSIFTPQETRDLVETARQANLNTIVIQIRRSGDAFYRSMREPRATALKDAPADYDPLQHLIELAHDTSGGKQRLDVWAWFVVHRVRDWQDVPTTGIQPIVRLHPDWETRGSGGEVVRQRGFLDPALPEVTEFTVNVVMDVVRNYEVDGINFDYIRYPEWESGYNARAIERFQRLTGRSDKPQESDEEWNAFRREQVTSFLRRCAATVWSEKPQIKITADTIGFGGISDGDFTKTGAFKRVHQDWAGWMAEHLLDVNCRMGYKRESVEKQARDFRDWARFSVASAAGRFATIGIGAYLNPVEMSLRQYGVARTLRAPGECFFSYLATSPEAAKNREARIDDGFFRRLRSELYAHPAPLPKMAWKDHPTEGIVAGWVFDANMTPADGAKIILRASSRYAQTIPQSEKRAVESWQRWTRADGGGFYAFTCLAPGSYDLSVEEPGAPRVLAQDVTVSAGQVIILRDPRTTIETKTQQKAETASARTAGAASRTVD